MSSRASKRTRMSASERREQLIAVARTLFAKKGFEATSIEEIANRAKVSKPVVYEHFGGKEGLYAVIVDRELTAIYTTVTQALESSSSASVIVERAALALLTYIEESSDGFRILSSNSFHTPSSGDNHGSDTYSTLLADVAIQVSGLLATQFSAHGLDPRTAPLYAQMLVGIVAMPSQWWLENPAMSKEEVAAHMVNLAWNGLRAMTPRPTLRDTPDADA
ncbi:MAG: TetR/AcrR family transcriptional regulator [Actinomyces ruminicola]|uniref:DNA-binding transcriptional regulator, AcrR family n=1 Tax=Actinomyces ruminicola TaxID=332524 RepID=A0A1H0EXB4_9ACTO|nr:TetR/AcrR family transcriptional regulator [Actinomyces ruminicola]MBE6481630.1 TetR/AcrR family transcriptional regulator [Actinomyces ruminicola]SDN23699.1 transcriptional regulator, TetR family [Actinomyces ruminicola]SDN87077.1 DNA-binding transcriptional regulator, AcrR family [Actinomyces ruminicola]